MTLKKSPTSADVGTARGIVGSSPKHEATIQSSFDLSSGSRCISSVPAYSTADARRWLDRSKCIRETDMER